MDLDVGELLPDLPALDNPGALVANNVIPAAIGYRPLPAFASIGSALSGRCQGAISLRSLALAIFNFAGDATKLYKFNGATLAWNDVSRTVGGAYATDAAAAWSMTQFSAGSTDLCIAVNGTDATQKFDMAAGTNFTALGGSPPIARFATTVRDFVMLGRVASFGGRVQWSGLGLPESWAVSATTQADYQDLARGGQINGLVGGEFAIILQERAINRASYVGSPVIFQFDEIARDLGCAVEGSVASYHGVTFFLSSDGFHMVVGGQEIRDIGHQKIDRTFLSDLDQSYLSRVSAGIDPINSLYIVSYPGAGNAGGVANRLAIYNWQIGRWAFGDEAMELVYSAASQTGYTLDTLDSLSSSLDALPASLDSGSYAGSGRLQLSGFDSSHKWGFFTGSNKAATVQTREGQLFPGRRAKVSRVWPLVDGSSVSATVTPYTRNRQNDASMAGAAVAQNSIGFCPLRADARYHRAQIAIAAGGSWTAVRGLDVEAVPGGVR